MFEKQLRLMNSELQDQRMAADLKDHLVIASRKEALYNVDNILDSLIKKEREEEERIEKERTKDMEEMKKKALEET